MISPLRAPSFCYFIVKLISGGIVWVGTGICSSRVCFPSCVLLIQDLIFVHHYVNIPLIHYLPVFGCQFSLLLLFLCSFCLFLNTLLCKVKKVIMTQTKCQPKFWLSQDLFQKLKAASGRNIKYYLCPKKIIKGTSDLSNPYVRSIFTLLLIKKVKKKKKKNHQ